ncbi:hypothetical protein FRC03_005367 [Tulasnella sp. 419]|nr:hypothetical protein FRC03_005367 [Tulasnella sp. 419]
MEMEEGYDHKFYCDVRARDTYFEASERISGYRVFMVNGSNPQDVILDKRQVMERFALSILHPLETVFDLKSNSLNIFYDKDGDLIAFNKGGDLFLNIRPYEQWHDEDVRKGKTENALISWYHTLAHQLAHDYIRYHNREHEFYFLAICEQHFLEFVKVLKTRPDM